MDEYYFLQPVPARQRRAMLREAGVARIDPTEREECRSLRISRGRCGCSCREVCRPPSCACYRSGIGCQVDQMAFPCSCSRSGCANPYGRVEFNAARVRAHFIRTLLQLGLEQNAATEYDSEPSPPAKRCCLEDDHLPTSLSSSFSPSSSSLLVSSSCVDGASVSATNGLEPETIYCHSAERLPGPETMVVAYDEDYDEDGDESSSETSSDSGASFDGILNDVSDCGTARTLLDARQSTLDNYVVRFSRQHTYTDVAASRCSIARFPGGSQLGTVAKSSLNAPLSCTVTCQSSVHQSHPLVGLVTTTTRAYCLSDSSAHVYCMPNVMRHNSSLCYSLPTNSYSVSVAATHDHPQRCYTADDTASCDYPASDDHTTGCFTEQQAAVGCSTQCSATCGCIVTYSSLTSSTQQGTTSVHSTPRETKHGNSVLEDTTYSCSAADMSGYSTPENITHSSHVPDITDNYDVLRHNISVADNNRHNYCFVDDTASSSYTMNVDDTRHGYSLPENTRNNSAISNDGADTAHVYSTQQETMADYSTLHDNTCSYSLLHVNARDCCTTSDTVYGFCNRESDTRSSCAIDSTARDHTVSDDNAHSHSTLDDVTRGHFRTDYAVQDELSETCDEAGGCYTADVMAHSSTASDNSYSQQATRHKYFVSHDVAPSQFIPDNTIHGNAQTDDAANDCFVPYDSVMPDDNIRGSCSLDDNTPDNAHACLVTENNAHNDFSADSTVHDHCVPDDTVCSHSSKGKTTFTYSATDTGCVIRSCSVWENSTDCGSLPDNTVDSSLVPCDERHGSSISENSGNSFSVPSYVMNSCPTEQNIRPSCVTCLKSDEIAVTAVTASSQLVQNGNCISDSDCQVSCQLSEIHGSEMTARDEAGMSETLNDVASDTDDTSLEHSSLRQTVTCSCAVAQSGSMITVTCVLSNQQTSAVKSDDITVSQNRSCITSCRVLCSVSDSQAALTTVHMQASSLSPDTNQKVAANDLQSDFQDLSKTSCDAEDLEYTCDVSSVASSLKCLNDNKNCTVNIALDSVSSRSDLNVSNTGCHGETDVVLTHGISEVMSTVDCHFDQENSVSYSSLDVAASDSEDISDAACRADCVDSSCSSATDHCDGAAAVDNEGNISGL